MKWYHKGLDLKSNDDLLLEETSALYSFKTGGEENNFLEKKRKMFGSLNQFWAKIMLSQNEKIFTNMFSYTCWQPLVQQMGSNAMRSRCNSENKLVFLQNSAQFKVLPKIYLILKGRNMWLRQRKKFRLGAKMPKGWSQTGYKDTYRVKIGFFEQKKLWLWRNFNCRNFLQSS